MFLRAGLLIVVSLLDSLSKLLDFSFQLLFYSLFRCLCFHFLMNFCLFDLSILLLWVQIKLLVLVVLIGKHGD